MAEDSRTILRFLAKGGAVIFLGMVLELGISFGAKLLVANYLTRADYGAVSIGVTMLAVVPMFVVLGLKTGIGRYLPRYEEEAQRRGVILSAFQIVLPLSVGAAAAIFLLAGPLATDVFDDPTVIPVLQVTALAIPFAAVYQLAIGGIQGTKLTVPKVAVQNVTLPVTRIAVVVLVLYLGFEAVGMAFAYAFAYVAAALVGLFYLHQHTPLFSRTPPVRMHRTMLAFSAPLVISGMMGKLLADLDTFLLGYFVGTGAVGDYNVVYPMALLLLTFQMSVGFVFLPLLSEFHADGRLAEMRRYYQLVAKWVLIGTLPLFLVLVLFPEMSISITFGEKYTGGALALAILSLGFFVHAAIGPNAETLTSIGETRLVMHGNTGAAVLNLLLNLYLIPRFSVVGAAVATSVSYVALNVAFSYQLYTMTDIQPFTRAMLQPAAAALGIVGVIYWITTSFLPVTALVVIAMFVVFLGCYVVAILRFGGIEREELLLIADLEHKFDINLEPVRSVARWFM